MTLASIVDFGAVAGDPSAAAANAQAFRDALDSGARRIFIPTGTWYLEEILFEGNPWLPAGVEIFGEGREDASGTVIRYVPTDDSIPAFQLWPGNPLSLGTIRDLQLIGRVTPGVNAPPVGVGISLDRSHRNSIRDVRIYDFEIGILLNRGASRSYSGYNVIERFSINRCRTGIFLGDGTNDTVIQGGRIWGSLVQYDDDDEGGAREEGTGIDVSGSFNHQPVGAQGLVISGVAVERAATGIRVVSSRDVLIQSCYLEPGSLSQLPSGDFPHGTVRRRSLFVDELTEGLSVVATHFSEPDVPPGQEHWTPTYVELPPERRGLVDASSAPASGASFDVNGYGGAISGTTAAHANRIKNADMSRGMMYWRASTPPPVITLDDTTFVTGGRSLRLGIDDDPGEHVYQDFVVDSGVRAVTVNVRYRLRTPGVHAFRFDVLDVASRTRLGFFSDVGPGWTAWRVRSLTSRFDGLPGSVVGPRTLRVRLFPYDAMLDPVPAGQQVIVDSVWVVDGEYAASYRPYAETVEVLVGDDREVSFSGVTSSDLGTVAAMPSRVPSNAVGMVVEIRVSATEATTHGGRVIVDDQQGSNSMSHVQAQLDGRLTLVELTVALTGSGPPLWSVLVGDPSNVVSYRVRLKQWILRP